MLSQQQAQLAMPTQVINPIGSFDLDIKYPYVNLTKQMNTRMDAETHLSLQCQNSWLSEQSRCWDGNVVFTAVVMADIRFYIQVQHVFVEKLPIDMANKMVFDENLNPNWKLL